MGTTATQDDPAAAVAALKAQGAPDEAIHAYLTQRYGAPVDTGPDATVKGLHAAYQKGLLPSIEQGKSADEASALPTKTGAVLETLETPLAGVPGGALAMSAARKLVDPSQSFASTQADVNRATSDTPASILGRGIGAVATGGVLPASGLKAGAILGGADQALNNDPNSGLLNRALRAPVGALVGGGLGAATDRVLNAGRALFTPSATNQVLALQDARTAANKSLDQPSYATAADQGKRYFVDLGNREDAVNQALARGTAEAPKALPAPGQSTITQQEARTGFANHDFTNGPPQTLEQAAQHDFTNVTQPTEPFQGTGHLQADFTKERPVQLRAANDVNVRQPETPSGSAPPSTTPAVSGATALRQTLSSPGIAPYANLARNFEQNAGANDYEIAAETHRLMSEAQNKKLALNSNGDFAAAASGQLQSIGAAKQRLRDAIGGVAPDFNAAVDQHRILSGELAANKQGYGLGQKILGGPPTAKQLAVPPKPNGTVPDPSYFLSRTLPQLTPAEAGQASRGLLASIKASGQGGSYNPFKAFGVLGSEPTNAALQTIDARAGNTLPSALQQAILSLAQAKETP